ncbi:DUF3140 domain-containing protein [Skermanella pratensis]|uniref:DUF3140 domain-containing protein n=1 Tax=Skermanella pratensis TaxID=2233999 RepID=UPI0013016425|nr:DUF3140 domain-containing protein [Skermanella pratensis]
MSLSDGEKAKIRSEYRDAVNMTPKELERWLEKEESKGVGFTRDGEDESVGHHSGRRIVEIAGTKQGDLTDDDYAHMRKVVAYVRRHCAQGPSHDVETSRWRYSLMNWGHDPLRKSG